LRIGGFLPVAYSGSPIRSALTPVATNAVSTMPSGRVMRSA
jgi:hypothetical protein